MGDRITNAIGDWVSRHLYLSLALIAIPFFAIVYLYGMLISSY